MSLVDFIMYLFKYKYNFITYNLQRQDIVIEEKMNANDYICISNVDKYNIGKQIKIISLKILEVS